jgi:hypothetical protein
VELSTKQNKCRALNFRNIKTTYGIEIIENTFLSVDIDIKNNINRMKTMKITTDHIFLSAKKTADKIEIY